MWIVPLFHLVSEWHQNSHIGFLYLNIGVGDVRIPKFSSELAFSKQKYFFHFQNFKGIFVSRSLLPNFCVLKAPAPSFYGNEILICQKSCFNTHICIENNSIINPKIWEHPFYYIVHSFTWFQLYWIFTRLHYMFSWICIITGIPCWFV